MAVVRSGYESVYEGYFARYDAAQLDVAHLGREHSQPRPEGEVRDRDGRIVLPGRAAVREECHCPTLRELIIGEVNIDIDAGRVVMPPLSTPRALKVWRLRTVGDLGLRHNGYDAAFRESDARGQAMAERLRQASVHPSATEEEAAASLEAWDRPMSEDDEAYYAKQFDAELAEADRQEVVNQHPLD